MRGSAIHHVGGNISFNGRTSYHADVFTTLERCRYHLLRNVIPTLLIVVGVSWISLLLTEQIYKAKQARLAALKAQQSVAMDVAGRTQPL